ncbi:MAG: hypothetical protein R3F11_22285 [Verrucomicrobiales bacterium]
MIGEPWARSASGPGGSTAAFTTGLVILTNDNRFSEALTLPGSPRRSLSHETDQPITGEAIARHFKAACFSPRKTSRRSPPGSNCSASAAVADDLRRQAPPR